MFRFQNLKGDVTCSDWRWREDSGGDSTRTDLWRRWGVVRRAEEAPSADVVEDDDEDLVLRDDVYTGVDDEAERKGCC